MANSSARSRRGLMGSSRHLLNPSPKASEADSQTVLGFQFRDPSLFQRALTHRSFCNENDLDATASYERLEFLGDAVLELMISDYLYRQFPKADEGQLTKARVALVRGQTLACAARRLGLGQYLMVGRGVEESGGRKQDSVLAAAMEAMVAAVYLDQGLDAARAFVERQLEPELTTIEKTSVNGAPRLVENPKSLLQEYLQAEGLPTPSYRVVERTGRDHQPEFSVEAVLGYEVIGAGKGGKKSDAERAAAQNALDRLTDEARIGEKPGADTNMDTQRKSGCPNEDVPDAPNPNLDTTPTAHPAVHFLSRLLLTRKRKIG